MAINQLESTRPSLKHCNNCKNALVSVLIENVFFVRYEGQNLKAADSLPS